jgi:hypothetical protein
MVRPCGVPRRADPDPVLPILSLAGEALAAGLTRDQVRHRVDSERWERVSRGAYVTDARATANLDRHAALRVNHAHRAISAASRNPDCVVAYHSAAFLLGLPVLQPATGDVVLGVPPGHWTGRRSGIHFRRLRLEPAHVLDLRVPVTTAARTWVDLASRGSLADALTPGDAGLRTGEFSRGDLACLAADVGSIPGWRRTELALPLVSGERETPLESASFAYFVERRVPLPSMQVTLTDDEGFVGRVDFLWEEASVVGESDGKLKYGTPGEAYREKLREDRLRALGFHIIRWGFADLRGPRLADRLHRVLGP